MDIKHSLKIEVRIHFRQEACRALRGRRARRGAAHYLRIYSVRRKEGGEKESVTAAQSQETYAEDIEKRLTEIVSSIDGAGKTRVMVTLESGAEQVYARNEKIKSDTSGGTALEKENFSDEKSMFSLRATGTRAE